MKRHRKALALALLLVPSILFAASLAVGAASAPRSVRLAQSFGDWGFNMTAGEPAAALSGSQVSVPVTIGIQVANGNFTVQVNDVIAELRQPTVINSTSGVVTAWAVLDSAKVNVNKNFTGSAVVREVLSLTAESPPSGGALELLSPTSSAAYNGVVDFTIYQQAGNQSSSSAESVSLVDSTTYYQSQLSTVVSSASWATYQLIAALLAAVFFIVTRPPPSGAGASPYASELEKFKAGRTLARLEEMKSSGMISQARYDELKEEYQRKLGRGEPEPTS